MRRCIRKLSLFAGLLLALHISLPTQLRAQQTEGKDLVPPVAPIVFSVMPTTRLSYQIVEGRAEPESRVVLTGGAQTALADAAYGTGLFTAFVRLREGKNDLTIVALDDAGASPPVTVTIERTGISAPLPPNGEAAQINISSGAAQQALPGTEFPRPLVALVTDARGFPVQNVLVEFTLRFGDARFAGGRERHKTRTDETGRARVRLVAGKNAGINLVRADFDGNTSSPAAFDVETVQPGSDNKTSVSGVLLDVFRHPLEGVTVHLGDRTAKTGRDGRFKMLKVKPGLDQRLEVFGEEIKARGYPWSDASYSIDVVAGIDNSLRRPLFVSPLSEGSPLNSGPPLALDSEGRVTSGAVLSWQDDYEHKIIPEVAVFRGVRITMKSPAKLEGQTFSATRVLSDRVPVTLDDGLATGNYFFVKPGRVTFNPALAFKFPNSDKLPPRSRVLIMHFDSLVSSWVKEGMARVSDDGQMIENEEGSGLRNGGWYAFPSERTQPEFTHVEYLQIEGNPSFEGKHIDHLEAYSRGKTALLANTLGNYDFKRIHFRVTFPALNGEVIVDNDKRIEPSDPSQNFAVTVTPGTHVMEPGGRLILHAVGRPHPGGYYVWTSDDPSVASVEPFLNDGGAEHPNRANVIARRPGKVKINAIYITAAGATTVGIAEVICRQEPE